MVASQKRMCRLALLVGCSFAALGIAGTPAQAQGLKPEPAPPTAGGSLRPDPAPGAQISEASSAVSSSPSSSASLPASLPSSRPAAGSASPSSAPPSSSVSRVTTHAPGHASEKRVRPSAPAKPARPLPSLALWTWRGALSAFGSGHASTPASSSLPLLAAGLALLVLVIGETTFLGLAASVFRIPARRPQESRRSVEASYPIRQILPRR